VLVVECNINISWDPDAVVWCAASDGALGLVLESGSLDALIERVKHAVPELMELNGISGDALIHVAINRLERVACG
jgi:hypothetical protein